MLLFVGSGLTEGMGCPMLVVRLALLVAVRCGVHTRVGPFIENRIDAKELGSIPLRRLAQDGVKTMANITIRVPDGYALTANVNDKPYQLTPDKMTNDALLHVMEYGFQRIINDKTGGKTKTDADKDAKATAMLARLSAEQYQRRRVGTAVDPLTAEVRGVMRALLKTPQQAERAKEYKAFSEAADREAYLDDWFDTMPQALADQVTAIANKKLAEKAKAAKAEQSLIEALVGSLAEMPTTPAPKKATAKKAAAK